MNDEALPPKTFFSVGAPARVGLFVGLLRSVDLDNAAISAH